MQSNFYQYISVGCPLGIDYFAVTSCTVSLTSPKKQAMLIMRLPLHCVLTNDRVYTMAHSCVTTYLNKQHMTETE